MMLNVVKLENLGRAQGASCAQYSWEWEPALTPASVQHKSSLFIPPLCRAAREAKASKSLPFAPVF